MSATRPIRTTRSPLDNTTSSAVSWMIGPPRGLVLRTRTLDQDASHTEESLAVTAMTMRCGVRAHLQFGRRDDPEAARMLDNPIDEPPASFRRRPGSAGALPAPGRAAHRGAGERGGLDVDPHSGRGRGRVPRW